MTPAEKPPVQGDPTLLAGGGGRVRRLRIVDAFGPRAVRRRFLDLQRKLGITRSGQIAVIGAYYEISSGAVDFLESDEDLRVDD